MLPDAAGGHGGPPLPSGPRSADAAGGHGGPRPARLGLVVLGTPNATRSWAEHFAQHLAPTDQLWVSPTEAGSMRPRDLRAHLGRGLALVCVDAHMGLDPDALAACHGFVRAGGALVIRLDPELPPPDARLAAWPFAPSEVGRRFESRTRASLFASLASHPAHPLPDPLLPPPPIVGGTTEQAALVAALAFTPGAATVLTADRGRGKSSALGLWLASLPTQLRVVVSATSPESVAEVLRFCPRAPFVPLDALPAFPPASVDLIVIDEAATVFVPYLRRIAATHPHAHLVFATTVHGYEGTGRGFALRFLPWLEAHRSTTRHTLREPIRWGLGCPLERAISDALLLGCDPVDAPGQDISRIEILDRQAISAFTAESERDLADLFGLLVHAHYRTTPGDLRRLLDAPNLAVHVVRTDPGDRIVAACLVAREGGLTPELAAHVHAGTTRLQAHALADALVAHLGAKDAGPMTMIRSVRIATHPALRRLGLARALVEHVHNAYEVDLFGTLFGASPDLLAFRRSLGYRLLRVSASRNQRTGEPSVLMVRPVSERAGHLVDRLERQLSRELDTQLELLAAEPPGLDPELERALFEGLPPPDPYTDDEALALVRDYANSPRTFESVATAITHFAMAADLSMLTAAERAVVTSRAILHQSWELAAQSAGLAHPGLAMRAMRRAMRSLVQAEPATDRS